MRTKAHTLWLPEVKRLREICRYFDFEYDVFCDDYYLGKRIAFVCGQTIMMALTGNTYRMGRKES